MKLRMPDDAVFATKDLLLEKHKQLQSAIAYENKTLEEIERSRDLAVKRLQKDEEQLIYIEAALASMPGKALIEVFNTILEDGKGG